MKKRRGIVYLLSLFTLASCGGFANQSSLINSKGSDTNSENNESSTSSKNSGSGEKSSSETSSSSSQSSVGYVNNVDAFSEEERLDILGDFDTQESEDLSEYTNIIDVSSLASGESKTIKEAGTYILTGNNDNAKILINSSDDVTIILNGVNLTYGDGSPFEVKNANSLTVHVASKTKNYFSDTSATTSDATFLVKKVALNLEGNGYLYINANGLVDDSADTDYGVGLQAAKGLNIKDTHLIINSNSHAIKAKSGLEADSASFYLTSKKDGIHSSEGGALISNSSFDAETYGDGIDAVTDVILTDVIGHFKTIGTYIKYDSSADSDGSLYEDSIYVLKDGEYAKISSDDMSRYSTRYYLEQKCKGLKSEAKVEINGGDYYFETADDCIASDTEIDILKGDLVLSTVDQAINCDKLLNIGSESSSDSDLSIKIFNAYEGIQGGQIHFYDGYTYIVSSDDGINATSDSDGYSVSMNFHDGAYVTVNADGDGIDSNGDIAMDGGNLLIFGPSGDGNGALDFDGTFTFTGGDLLAIGSNGMAQTPNTNSINAISYTGSNLNDGELISISSNGYEFSVILPKTYNGFNIVAQSEKFVTGNAVAISKDVVSNATFRNGVYFGETLSNGGTSLVNGTISKGLTSLGNSQGGGNDHGTPGGGGRPGGR